MQQRLAGKIAIITAAGSGIGRACALRFAAEGATVVVNDIRADHGAATVQLIADQGGRAVFAPADVTVAAEVENLVTQTAAQFGRIDILFNNAGGALPTPTHETSIEDYRRIIALNLDSTFYGIHAALPIMLKQQYGVILSTTSGAGLNVVLHLAAYGAAKAGVINLTRNIAVEYGHAGIRANIISPGPMDTPGLRAWLDTVPGGAENYARQIPSGRLGTAEDIANVAAFLACDEAAFVNGVVVPVDGAIHAQLATPRIPT
jgi:NAD(P)-dependent dehydrogenase (short-subunit alcohol dehydrogenase family)